MTPDQPGELCHKRQLHQVANHINAAARFDVGPEDLELGRGFPDLFQGSLRGKNQRCPGPLVDVILVPEPKEECAVPRMTVTPGARDVLRRLSNFDIIKKPASLPTTTWTLNAFGQQSVAGNDPGPAPGNANESPGRRPKSKVANLLPIPGNNHRGSKPGEPGAESDGGVVGSV